MSFSDQLNSEVNKLLIEANHSVAMFAFDVLKYLIEHSLVDTSKLISNWQLRLDYPALIEIEAYYEGQKGNTKSESEAEALDNAFHILSYRKPGDDIYISNNADYIEKLRDYGFIPEDIILDAVSYAESRLMEIQ